MRLISFLLILLPVVLLTNCTGNKKKAESPTESQVKVPPPSKQQDNIKQNPMVTNEAPGYATKFDRGKKRRESIVDKFDDQGNLIERTENIYDQMGNIKRKHRYTYKYNELGHRVEQWFYQYHPDGSPMSSSVNYTTYNNKGWKTENTFIGYDAGGNEVNWAKNVYEHNAEGQVTQDVTSNKAGFPVFKVNYYYEDGELSNESFVYYDGKGNVTDKKSLKYDKSGRIIETNNE
jgi:hypothetical protein